MTSLSLLQSFYCVQHKVKDSHLFFILDQKIHKPLKLRGLNPKL